MGISQTVTRNPAAMLATGLVLGAAAVIAAPGVVPVAPAATHAAPVLYDEGRVVELYQASSPGTVEITVRGATRTGRAFQTGQGSGFLVDEDGTILTNYHVVQGQTSVQVSFPGGRTVAGRVIATEPAEDLAAVQVAADAVRGIAPLPLGDSSLVRPGQMAIALGSPYGLENSITVGVISGVDRTIRSVASRPITGALQTDASINPGNSGGPLLDSAGRVVGINTAIEATEDGGNSGVGFAVPINTAKDFLGRARTSPSASTSIRPWLGISGSAVTPDLAAAHGISVESGVYLAAVVPGSPAAAAGLTGNSRSGVPGDVITAVDGVPVRSVEDLVKELNKHRPGDSVTLEVNRAGESIRLTVTLGEWPTN
jgi:S1-C subfamily serine protease